MTATPTTTSTASTIDEHDIVDTIRDVEDSVVDTVEDVVERIADATGRAWTDPIVPGVPSAQSVSRTTFDVIRRVFDVQRDVTDRILDLTGVTTRSTNAPDSAE